MHRTFDYSLPQSATPSVQEQLAIDGKTLADAGRLVEADSVLRVMEADFPHYAYTRMLHAYLCQKRAEQYAASSAVTDQTAMRLELNEAAAYIEQLAEQAKDSVEVCRTLLLTAADLRYQAEDDANARTDFQRILELRPSRQDSLDVYLMQADFEQMDSLYVEAQEHYALYLNSLSPLPHDAYTANAAVGYLQCMARQKQYAALSPQADRFIGHEPGDIRFRRYKRIAMRGLALTDSLTYAPQYYASLDYVLKGQFPDSLYSYDDYYSAADVALNGHDDVRGYADYMRRCFDLYPTLITDPGYPRDELFAQTQRALNVLGAHEEVARFRQEYAAIKRQTLGDEYEPYADYVNEGIAYYKAMQKVGSNNESDERVLHFYTLSDSCFLMAQQRVEAVDSLRGNMRSIIGNRDVLDVALLNLLQADSLRSVHFLRMDNALAAFTTDDADLRDDVKAYRRNHIMAVLLQQPAEKPYMERLDASFDASAKKAEDILRAYKMLMEKSLEDVNNEAAFFYLQHADSLLALQVRADSTNYEPCYLRGQLHLAYDKQTTNEDAAMCYQQAEHLFTQPANPQAPKDVQTVIYKFLILNVLPKWQEAEPKSEEDRTYTLQLRHYVNALAELAPSDNIVKTLKPLKALWSEETY